VAAVVAVERPVVQRAAVRRVAFRETTVQRGVPLVAAPVVQRKPVVAAVLVVLAVLAVQ
jgi:hypothetical protein